jgi:hypothetical protein
MFERINGADPDEVLVFLRSVAAAMPADAGAPPDARTLERAREALIELSRLLAGPAEEGAGGAEDAGAAWTRFVSELEAVLSAPMSAPGADEPQPGESDEDRRLSEDLRAWCASDEYRQFVRRITSRLRRFGRSAPRSAADGRQAFADLAAGLIAAEDQAGEQRRRQRKYREDARAAIDRSFERLEVPSFARAPRPDEPA